MNSIFHTFLTSVLVLLALLIVCCLYRSVIGPTVPDRIVSVNMIGTIVIVIMAILAVMMDEGYLVDVCLIFSMMSFLAVVLLSKIYIGVYREKKQKENAHD